MNIHINNEGKSEIVREHWYEWFFAYLPDPRRTVGLGDAAPRFYLPVGQERLSGRVYYWILPLAPFAMILSLANHAFKSVWFDLVELVDILQEFANQKRR